MIRILPADVYRVEAVGDEQAALAAIVREAPQVIVVAVPSKGGPDLVRRLRGADASGQACLLAILEAAPSGKEIANLVAAGAHDFMRRPILDAELVERIKAPSRLLRWARSVTKPASFDFSGSVDVSQLQAWENLGTLVAEDLTQITSQTYTVSPGWPARFTHGVESATIPMSLAEDRLEVRISIAVDSLTLSWLREALLGDAAADEAATDDVLRELANTAGGAVKRAALCENITLTTGLPVNDQAASFPGDHHCWTLAPENGDACIAVIGQIRSHENQRVAASKLAEGMVLAHDLRNEGGILLAPAGARLTKSTATKLAAMLGPRFFLEVAPVT